MDYLFRSIMFVTASSPDDKYKKGKKWLQLILKADLLWICILIMGFLWPFILKREKTPLPVTTEIYSYYCSEKEMSKIAFYT